MVARAADPAETQYGGAEADAARASEIAGDFRCRDCGYGIVSRGVLPTCPMCHRAAWQASPLTRAADAGRS